MKPTTKPILTALLFVLLTLEASPAHAYNAHFEGAGRSHVPTVMVVGDSHVEQLGPDLSALIRRMGGQPVGYLARRGWSTDAYGREGDLRARIEERGTPDVLIVSLGGNDRPSTHSAYTRQLTWIVAEARLAGVQEILWIGPASTHLGPGARGVRAAERVERNTEWQRELLPRLGVHWTDSRLFTTEGHQPDGLHFTRAGYRSWSRTLMQLWTRSSTRADRSPTLSHIHRVSQS